MVILVGLAAAVLLGGGYVLQQHQAAEVPAGRLRPGLLLVLIRRPVWLAGIATMVGGQLLGATALDLGSLVIVEPLLSTNVLFALPLAAVWSRRRLQRPDWIGAISMVVGLGLLLGLDQPRPAASVLVGPGKVLIGGLTLAGIVVLLVGFAFGRQPRIRALMLATAAGTVFGMQDLLTQQLVRRMGHGFLALLSWPLLGVIVAAIVGLTLSQNAFSITDLSASLPAMTLAEPVSGLMLSILLLGQGLRTSPWLLLAGTIGLALMVVGVVLLTRSPLLLDPHKRNSS
jgi:drug/metabolite transporter (DMT)-like permease